MLIEHRDENEVVDFKITLLLKQCKVDCNRCDLLQFAMASRDDRKRTNADFLFFCGHSNTANELVGKFIFSQWYPSPFIVGDVTYKTARL